MIGCKNVRFLPKRYRDAAKLFRLHGVGRQGQADKFGIHLDDCGQAETANAVRDVRPNIREWITVSATGIHSRTARMKKKGNVA